ncbi:MAG: UDP-N-acetylenolpyruvoylglucosamine reductase, partial [Actinomycetota bacterium]|nr:UDP-N-acetylenolpyruvoylglucosamine reductase [Actinomycetota bacterium]
MVDDIARDLAHASGRVSREVALTPLTTYRLGGPAAVLFEPASVADLELLARAIATRGAQAPPVLVLGRGSNVVVADEGWPGVVVRMGPGFA